MQKVSPSKQTALSKRQAMMTKIRSSMQTLSLISQNQAHVRTKIASQKSVASEYIDTNSSSDDNEVKTDFFKADIFQQKYQLLEKLGEGSSGVVHKCRKRKTGQVFAAKQLRFQDEHLPGLKSNFLVMSRLNHPSIIKHEAAYFDPKTHIAWLVMEYTSAPSLLKAKFEDEEDIKEVIKKLLEAIKYLHKHDIAHRDIKPENVLYDPHTKEIKIIDFGISRRYKRRGENFDMWTITGTLYYRAPEMFMGSYREGVDIWAVGVMLYKIICGRTPFESQYHHETIKNIQEAKLEFSAKFDAYSPKLKALIQKMLSRNPENRPRANECGKDAWFATLQTPLFCRQATTNYSDTEEDSYLGTGKNHSHGQCALKKKNTGGLHESPKKPSEALLGKCLSMNSIKSYVKKINGGEFHIIDSSMSGRY